MATSKVFHIVELLEAILLELPIRNVLLAQRMEKGWKETISGSIKLQRSLFLKPISLSSIPPSYRHNNMHFLDLDTTCATVLETTGPMTLLTGMLPITEPTKSGILHLNEPLPDTTTSYMVSWKTMLCTQPPRSTEHFYQNSTNEMKAPDDSSLQFHSSGRMSHSGGAVIEHGTMFSLSAVKLEKPGGIVVLGNVVEALHGLSADWDGAELTGAAKGDFGWVGIGPLNAVVNFWEDVVGCVAEDVVG